MRKARPIRLAIILLLLLQTMFSFNSLAGPFTQVTIEPESQDVVVNVAPGSSGLVSTGINVTCQSTSPVPVTVTLSGNCPGAAVSLSPVGFTFQTVGTETKQVTVDIAFPLLTSTSEDPVCTVLGTWSQGATSGATNTAVINVEILPFFDLKISSPSPDEEVLPGGDTSFFLLINNTGNSDDTYRLRVENDVELDSKKIDIQEIYEIQVPEDGSENFELPVRTSTTTPEDKYMIMLKITSIGSETESDEVVFKDYLMILEVNAVIGIPDFLIFPIYLVIILAVIITGFVVYKRRRSSNSPNP